MMGCVNVLKYDYTRVDSINKKSKTQTVVNDIKLLNIHAVPERVITR